DVKVFSQPDLVAAALADYLERRPEMKGDGQVPMFLTTGDPSRVSDQATRFLRRRIDFHAA
ncbi:MAG: glutamate racemase, partial [Silicimonas sp.]|nr:glutamate racemase [Silicimonas sp.]